MCAVYEQAINMSSSARTDTSVGQTTNLMLVFDYSVEQWKKTGCLGYIGEYNYCPVMWGLFHKPWNGDLYQTTSNDNGKYPAGLFFIARLVMCWDVHCLQGWESSSTSSRHLKVNCKRFLLGYVGISSSSAGKKSEYHSILLFHVFCKFVKYHYNYWIGFPININRIQ